MSEDRLASFGDPRLHERSRGAIELREDVEGGAKRFEFDEVSSLLQECPIF